MSKWAALASSNTAMVTSAVAFAVVAVGAAFYINDRAAPATGVQVAAPAPVAVAEPEADTLAAVTSDAARDATPPSIDEVRVEPDGLTIVAGRAVPGSKVSVLLDGIENTSVTTDAGGGFAAITSIQSKTTAQILTIVQRLGDVALSSVDEIILAPSAPSAPSVPRTELATEEGTQADLRSAPTEARSASAAAGALATASQGVTGAATEEGAETAPQMDDPVASTETALDVPAAEAAASTAATALRQTNNTVATIDDGQSVPDGASLREQALALNEDPSARSESPGLDPAQSNDTGLDLTQSAEERFDIASDRNAAAAPQHSPDQSTGTDQVAGGQTTQPDPNGSSNTTADAGPAARAVDAPPQSAPVPQAVTVLRSTSEGVEVLGPPLALSDTIAIDTISYSDLGEVQLAGRAQARADVVRVYVNNRPVTELPVDPVGRWRGDLPGIDTGVYTLRVDEVNAAGTVMSRVETPFKREDPLVLAEADTDATTARQITVQTGATLWAIARDRYGEGLLYVQVFEANRGAIRDPDLIYPGQVFDLPD